MSIYKLNIDKALNKIQLQPNEFIYGGITKHTIEERLHQHIKQRTPIGVNSQWKMFKNKPVTRINIKSNTPHEVISVIENDLITKLCIKYGDRCINDKNVDGTPAQRGGAGEHDIEVGETYSIYIMYGPVLVFY